MLEQFIVAHRADLAALCVEKSALRLTPPRTGAHGAKSAFLDCLARSLVAEAGGAERIAELAAGHGLALLEEGHTLHDVIHEYGDVCQAITEVAARAGTTIPASEFGLLNARLDGAMAAAVTEYSHQRDLGRMRERTEGMHQRLGAFAERLRKLVDAAESAVARLDSRGDAMDAAVQSFARMRDAVDRSLAEIRAESGMTTGLESVAVDDLLRELEPWARIEASWAGCGVAVIAPARRLGVRADRRMLVDATRQLVRKALRSTPNGTTVVVRAAGTHEHVRIEVEDQCGGLAPAQAGDAERTIHERNAEELGGRLHLRTPAGRGCVFVLELPRDG
jgi:signal transduction histidine kinase